MSISEELQKIREILLKYNNLGASYLVEDEHIHSQYLNDLVSELESKLRFIDLIDEEIEELEEQLADKDRRLEILDVETIRTRNQLKKSEKKLKKLEPLETNRLDIGNTENDKFRYHRNLAKLSLIKRITDITVDPDNKVLLSTPDGSFNIFQANKSNSNNINTDLVWKKLGESSPYIKEWEALFGASSNTEN